MAISAVNIAKARLLELSLFNARTTNINGIIEASKEIIASGICGLKRDNKKPNPYANPANIVITIMTPAVP
ncbi:MAG: hypothetical protein P8J68_11135 [Arenicellaceae bacterium]|nr:hypothetical protein [Arenicellaceae bacterium]